MIERLCEALDCWSDYMPTHFTGVSKTRLGLESVINALKTKDTGACTRPEGCVCGGDTERVRKACANWSES